LADFGAFVHILIEMAASDSELLEKFKREKSDDAFGQLVSRYVDLVYAAAMRQVRDPHVAQDVTQAAFIVLAKRASAVSADRLAGWLLTTTRFCAKDAIKKQIRRTHYEREAAAMKALVTTSQDASETEIAAALDEAMSRLRTRESTAVALRYLQNRPMNEVATALGVSVDAAQKIVSRSLVKLRKLLGHKGITLSSVAVLSAALSHFSAPSASAAVVTSVTQASAQSLFIAKGAINMMFWTRMKLAAMVGATVVLAGGTGVAVLNRAMASRPPMVSPPVAVSAAPLVETASPTTQPINLVGFGSPFLELAGCRLKETVVLDLRSEAQPQQQVKWTACEYPQVRWKIDPALAAKVSSYSIMISDAAGAGGAETIAVDKNSDVQPLIEELVEPGEYSLRMSALDDQSKTVAQGSAHITIAPMPYTQIQINDFQADGSIGYTIVIQGLNTSNREIATGVIGFSDFVHVESTTDDAGDSIPFELKHQGNMIYASYTLNQPVQPGDPILGSASGTLSGLIKQLPSGIKSFKFNQSPGMDGPTRRIELYRLPAGAKLISVTPSDLPTQVIDGRVQIYMETIIPPGGSSKVKIKYQ
jgi:RNA polymerase sigma factor (sigma-70 family)